MFGLSLCVRTRDPLFTRAARQQMGCLPMQNLAFRQTLKCRCEARWRSDDSCHGCVIKSGTPETQMKTKEKKEEAATSTLFFFCWRHTRGWCAGLVFWLFFFFYLIFLPLSIKRLRLGERKEEKKKAVSDHLKHRCAAGDSASFV